MSSYKYINLCVRNVPRTIGLHELSRELELYGEMNLKVGAFTTQPCPRKYNPYMSPRENMREPIVDDEYYNVILYGFRVRVDLISNVGRMFYFIMKNGKNRRHSWYESDGEIVTIDISEDKRPIPSDLVHRLLWT